jgi:hypothetical protein
MRQFLYFARIAGFVLSIIVAFLGRAHALLIIPSFDATLTGNPNAVAFEAAINTAVKTVNSLYGNPGTVRILFDFNSGVHGQSQDGESFVSYPQYVSQLSADSVAHPANGVLATALAHIATGNTADFVLGTTAFLRVGLGFTGSGTTPCYNAAGSFVNSCGQIFDGIVSIGNLSTASNGPGKNSQAVSVLEHEINEVLGGGGGGTTIGENLAPFLCPPNNQSCGLTAIGPIDPYRFHASGATCASVTNTPSFTTSSAEVACYSIDGGQTTLVQMNQAGGGSDFGDFANVAVNIQDAFDPGVTDVYSFVSPETIMMQSIGWDLPEPSTLALIAGALGGLCWMRGRRARPA